MSVPVSSELFAPVSPGVELCYQTFGSPEGQPLLLVMGLGGPMTWWDPAFCTMLAEAGFHVVRFDNRDVGRSSRLRGRVTRARLAQSFVGRGGPPPYTLSDLSDDAIGLMDHMGWDASHVVGISMGGMIAQTMAVENPHRVRSLTSMMSTLGKRSVGWQHPSLLPMLVGRRVAGREGYIESSVRSWQLIGSPAYPIDPDEARARAGETFDRGISASGVMRQMLAVLSQPNRARALGSLQMPVTVLHGAADKMVHVSGGRATARAVPGAELIVIDGMGHDLPRVLYPTFTDVVRRTAARAGFAESDRSA